jgi:hypothetical protein
MLLIAALETGGSQGKLYIYPQILKKTIYIFFRKLLIGWTSSCYSGRRSNRR